MNSPVVLIFGAGANIGAEVASTFSKQGYQIATVARSGKDGKTADGRLHITADLSRSSSVPDIFQRVKQELGTPSVVIYNGASKTNSKQTSSTNNK